MNNKCDDNIIIIDTASYLTKSSRALDDFVDVNIDDANNDNAVSSPSSQQSRTLTLRTLLVHSSVFRRSLLVIAAFIGLYLLYFFMPNQGYLFDQIVLYTLLAMAVAMCVYEDWYCQMKKKSKTENNNNNNTKDNNDNDDVTLKSESDTENSVDEECGMAGQDEQEERSSVHEESSNSSTRDVPTIEEASGSNKTKKQHPLVEKYLAKRLPYLDVIKVVMIVIVVVNHTALSTGLPGGNYPFSPNLATSLINPVSAIFAVLGIPLLPMAMSLLFFASGVFTPRSANNKTLTEFLNGKLKRLVFPAALVNFVIGPLAALVWDASTLNPTSSFEYRYEPNFLSMWFLLYLAIFNLAYAFVAWAPTGGNSGRTATATTVDGALREWFRRHLRFDATLFLWIMVIGGVANACGAYGLETVGTKFLRRWGLTADALPGWFFYFLLGCFAGQEGWMDRFFERRARRQSDSGDKDEKDDGDDNDEDARARDFVTCCYYTSPVFAVITLGSFLWLQLTSEQMTSGAISASIFEWICVGLVSSVLGLALTIVTVDWACRKIRSINLTLLCMMQASFAVYVFHELVMNLVMWLWIFILKTGFGFDLVFDGLSNTTDLPGWIIMLGWLFVSILTQAIVWPLAFFVRKIPPLNRIL